MKDNPTLVDILDDAQAGLIKLSRYTFLEPVCIGHLAVLCKSNNSLIDINECKGNAASFLSRMNFYKYVGLPDFFSYSRFAGNNKNTIEINVANNANHAVYQKVEDLLSGEPQDSIDNIERLLAELITNVEMYATFGVVVGQVILRVLHLAVVDTGPGIAAHLKEHNAHCAQLSDDQVILESLKKGITSGRGRGFGLWQTHEILARNQGTLTIRSGNHVVDGVSKAWHKAKTGWLGTSVELRYNLDKPVDFGEILKIQDSPGGIDEYGF